VYGYHTVPVAIHACLRNVGDFRSVITEIVSCGGDADTTSAIVGGIIGSGVGKEGIPCEWLDNLCEWPRTTRWMQRLARQVGQSRSEQTPLQPLRLSAYGVLLRNLLFLIVVLFHAVRRLLPRY